MRVGFSMLMFAPSLTEDQRPWLDRIREAGYDGVEVPVTEGEDADYERIAGWLDEVGLARTAVGFVTGECNPISSDASVREAARARLRVLIERAARLGSDRVCGPIHSAYAQFTGAGPSEAERECCVDVLASVADFAQGHGVRLGIEFLNRFECYFATTAAQAADVVRRVGHPAVRVVYDTHHAHIEEDEAGAAIRGCADVLGHVQISESHRGVLGRGQVRWDETFAALRATGYDDWLVVESFSRLDPEFGAALRIWRDLAARPEDVVAGGAAFVRGRWHAARSQGHGQ